MREIFCDFKLNIPEKFKLSEYMAVHIHLDSAYKWGRGWTAEEEREFKGELYPLLKEKGFEIVPPDIRGSSDSLILPSSSRFGNHFSCYMHPMDFSCCATDGQLDMLCDALSKADCIKSYKIGSSRMLYDITDREYEDILIDNADRILDAINSYRGSFYEGEVGFDFAHNSRLFRIGNNSGVLTSDDVDVKFVTNLVKLRDKLNLKEFTLQHEDKTWDMCDREENEEMEL